MSPFLDSEGSSPEYPKLLPIVVYSRKSPDTDSSQFTSFQGYAMGKKVVYAVTPNRTSSVLSYGELAAAGFFSAIPTTLVAAPVERVKVLLQVRLVLEGAGNCRRRHTHALASSISNSPLAASLA